LSLTRRGLFSAAIAPRTGLSLFRDPARTTRL